MHEWQKRTGQHMQEDYSEDEATMHQSRGCDLSKQIQCANCGKYWTKMEVMAGEHLMVHDDTRDVWVCVTCL